MAEVHLMAFRGQVPTRSTTVEPRNNYRDYKGELRADFGRRCGYCDELDEYFGGVQGAHIDHFAPKKEFLHLEAVYDNLVYACPFCNRAKSNKWIGDDSSVPNNGTEGFVDPCSPEFDEHLARDTTGRVVSLTHLGQYMVDNLNLRLMRHQFIWQAQRLAQLAEELDELIPLVRDNRPVYLELLELQQRNFSDYRMYLRRANDG